MEIEIRNKDGVMFGKIKGKYALIQYDNFCNRKEFFERTTKNIVGKGTFVTFNCIDYSKLIIIPDNFEILLEPGDYLKIN